MQGPRRYGETPEVDWNQEPSPEDVFGPIDLALYVTDADGYLTFYNASASRLWGRSPVIGRDRWCGSWRIRTSEGEVLPHSECPMALSIRQDRPVQGMRAFAERPDGSLAAFVPYPMPIRDDAGRLVAAANILFEPDRARMPLPSADAQAAQAE